MRMNILIAAAVAALSLTAPAAPALAGESIAAIVNDDVITNTDVAQRMEMIIKSSNLPDTAEFRDRIAPQVISALIQEQIQLQESERLGIKIEKEAIQDGLKKIAEQNNIPFEQFLKILDAQKIPMPTMERQIRAQIAWGQVIQNVLRPQVVVSDQDIDSSISRMLAMAGKTEYMIAEIFQPATRPEDLAQTRALMQRLHDQIKQGAPFPAVARQFSASASAAQGGMIGWVTADSLDPALADALQALPEPGVTPVIESREGFHILLLRDKRALNFADPDDITLQVKELRLPFDDKTDKSENRAREVMDSLTGCLDIDRKATEWGTDAQVKSYNVRIGEMPTAERTEYQAMNIGQAATPQLEDNILKARMVCGKTMPQGEVPDRESVQRKIGMERIDILQKSYLRDLQSQAYIETRMN